VSAEQHARAVRPALSNEVGHRSDHRHPWDSSNHRTTPSNSVGTSTTARFAPAIAAGDQIKSFSCADRHGSLSNLEPPAHLSKTLEPTKNRVGRQAKVN
jgi:hypothetical protein